MTAIFVFMLPLVLFVAELLVLSLVDLVSSNRLILDCNDSTIAFNLLSSVACSF